jgi:endogenous inhibitor of DNA gyrase (YacG/DUF329 family)
MARYSYFAEHKRACPLTRDTLAELYLGHSPAEIALIVADEWGSVPAGMTVRSWLAAYNIPLRTRSESLLLRERQGKNSQIHTEEAHQKGRATLAPFIIGNRVVKFGRAFTDADRRKSGNITRARLAETHVTRNCSHCNKPVTRPPYRMRSEHVFCNKSCSNRWLHQQNPEKSHSPEAHAKQAEALKQKHADKKSQRRAEFTPLGLLDIEQAAERARVSVAVAQKAAEHGKLIAWSDSPGKLYRAAKLYREDDIDLWIKSRQK